ncbi:hypothetical protein J3R83DRAFT_7719 [Lanmaoa asiatica]|nr:hypothetical protein J3R83DRAFT_8887 [Lanmaoa asiatica]KAH0825901.1 hypothetical protein J3R83DRAFT_7719 [Lanmaoa asiatica]
MDTFAALALATDPVSPALLNRKPNKLTTPLFTIDMYKQISLQSMYQIAIMLIFHFFGLQILGLEDTLTNDMVVHTVVFNIFMFAQISNSFNSRRLDRKLNIFEGLLNNYYFVVITLISNIIHLHPSDLHIYLTSCRDCYPDYCCVYWPCHLPGDKHQGS